MEASLSQHSSRKLDTTPPMFSRWRWAALALAMSMGALWARSYWRADDLLIFTSGGKLQSIGSDRGCIRVMVSGVEFGAHLAGQIEVVSGRATEPNIYWPDAPAIGLISKVMRESDLVWRVEGKELMKRGMKLEPGQVWSATGFGIFRAYTKPIWVFSAPWWAVVAPLALLAI